MLHLHERDQGAIRILLVEGRQGNNRVCATHQQSRALACVAHRTYRLTLPQDQVFAQVALHIGRVGVGLDLAVTLNGRAQRAVAVCIGHRAVELQGVGDAVVEVGCVDGLTGLQAILWQPGALLQGVAE